MQNFMNPISMGISVFQALENVKQSLISARNMAHCFSYYATQKIDLTEILLAPNVISGW